KAAPIRVDTWKTEEHLNLIAIAEAIGRIGVDADEAASTLLERLKQTDGFQPAWIIEGLGKLGEAARPALPELMTAAQGDGFQTRAAIEALGQMGSAAEDAIPTLVKIAQSDRFLVDKFAVEALGNIG